MEAYTHVEKYGGEQGLTVKRCRVIGGEEPTLHGICIASHRIA